MAREIDGRFTRQFGQVRKGAAVTGLSGRSISHFFKKIHIPYSIPSTLNL